MKHDWKKAEKQYYLPRNRPEFVTVPAFGFFTLEGTGNPNDSFFAEYIGVLYSLSYAVKMSLKKGLAPEGYFDYSVYPLEGIWDLKENARAEYSGSLDKNNLAFKLIMRQPDFTDSRFAFQMIDFVRKHKPHDLLEKVRFEQITEGTCIQMLHTGSYDSEPDTFRQMEQYAEQTKSRRIGRSHHEIYLSDARRVSPETLRTVLRFCVEAEHS